MKQEAIMNESNKLSAQSEKKLRVAAWIVTALVLILVGLMRRPEMHINLPEGVSLSFLPLVHACLNSLVAVSLVSALVFIKKGDVAAHKRMMTVAMMLSVLFLLCYVAYHFTSSETRFGGTGAVRHLYFYLLISHITCAAVSFPMILFTYLAGWANRIEAHKKLAKLTYPIWLYVAVTGPLCYLMLRPYY
jgi:putative membrane protein